MIESSGEISPSQSGDAFESSNLKRQSDGPSRSSFLSCVEHVQLGLGLLTLNVRSDVQRSHELRLSLKSEFENHRVVCESPACVLEELGRLLAE